MMRFAAQCAIVTGSTSGISAATARERIAEGAEVVTLTYAPAHELSDTMTAGWLANGERVDIADREAVEAVVAALSARRGVAALLVNNTGYWVSNAVPDSAPELFDRLIDVNLKGSSWVPRACLLAMTAAGRGAIVFLASVSGVAGRSGDSGDSAAKASVAMLPRTPVAEVGQRGTRVNCICPGAVSTPMTAALRTPEGEATVAALMDRHPTHGVNFGSRPSRLRAPSCSSPATMQAPSTVRSSLPTTG